MNKFLELLIKYLGIPLMEKFIKWATSEIKKHLKRKDIIKEQSKKTKAIEDAKDPTVIRSAHRNNKL